MKYVHEADSNETGNKFMKNIQAIKIGSTMYNLYAYSTCAYKNYSLKSVEESLYLRENLKT